MTMVSKTALGIAAGICGTIFVGYCVYFDNKRRSDPNFKQKLKERRKRAANSSKKPSVKLPDFNDHQAVQSFFLEQVQLGEELLGKGEVETGVEHLCNAVAICGQPNQLLKVLQQTLPPQVFQLLLQRLPVVSESLVRQPMDGMTEDDVE